MVQITKINRDVTNFIYGYIDFQKIILYMQSFDVLCSNIPLPPTSLAAYGKRAGVGDMPIAKSIKVLASSP
jgi:hypothetical protein